MPHISYSNNASFDLIRIFNFLAEKDPATAKKALKEIRDHTRPVTLEQYLAARERLIQSRTTTHRQAQRAACAWRYWQTKPPINSFCIDRSIGIRETNGLKRVTPL
jgi:plasmid stabilization system protein ParE